MIILGIDPGSRFTGFAVIEVIGRKLNYLDSGILNFSKEKDFLKRIPLIFEESLALIEKYKPTEIAIESLIFVKNVNSLAKLSQARGAILSGLTVDNQIPIAEYSPNLIKSSVSGYGHSSKEQISKSLKLIFGKEKINFIKDDESDALAIAVTHFLLRNSRSLNKRIAS